MSDELKEGVIDAAYKRTKELFKAFRSDGTATKVREYLKKNA